MRDLYLFQVLSHLTLEDGQNTTPLIIAARNGHEKVVLVLLSNFKATVEQTGTVRFDGYSIEGATPLWCAAGAGHLGIVKMLIEYGSYVDHPTITNSTPLRAACFDGRLDIVKFLLGHKADLTIANKYKNTCLMISCYKGHKDVVKHLLDSGAPTDSKAHCGATALHFAAECGHVEIVKLLVQHEAGMMLNDSKMTPLLVAAECGQANVVEYMTSLDTCQRTDIISAYELLGASFANDKEQYDIQRAFEYIYKGMKERLKDPDNVIEKKLSDPVPAYGNHVECRTIKDIEALKSNEDALHMEGLTIRERILGQDNPELLHPVVYRGAVFADAARFDRCLALWLHAMTLRQKNFRSISKDLLRFAQVLSQMVHLGKEPDIDTVLQVFRQGTLEMTYDRKRLKEKAEEEDALYETYEENIHTLMYLLVIITKLKLKAKFHEDLCSAVYQFLRLRPKLRNGYTPLHMANDSATIVDDFHVVDEVSFPSGGVCKLLIDCGADTDAQDKYGNTPLHVIVKYINPIDDFENLHECMISLIKADAHMDIVNKDGKTALDISTTGVAEIIIRTNNKIRLICIAARAVKEYKLPYKGLIPTYLEEFLELH